MHETVFKSECFLRARMRVSKTAQIIHAIPPLATASSACETVRSLPPQMCAPVRRSAVEILSESRQD
jgi:hypothetical protein